MKKLTKLMMMMAVVCMLAWVSQAAPRLVQLPWQMATRYDATHMLEFTYNDLTQTATNTAMVFTNTIAAPASVKFQGMLLDVAFDSATTTNAFSMTLSCGAGSSSTKWLNAKQVAADGTEVETSWGTDYTATVALTLVTNLVVAGEGTSEVYFVTGTTGTSALASPLLNEQSSDISIITTFGTAGDDRNHAELESGKVRLFFKVLNLGG